MLWFARDWLRLFGQSEPPTRQPRRSAAKSVECLEPRLCLGSMTPFAPEPLPFDEPVPAAETRTINVDGSAETPDRRDGVSDSNEPTPTVPAAQPESTKATAPAGSQVDKPAPTIVGEPLPGTLSTNSLADDAPGGPAGSSKPVIKPPAPPAEVSSSVSPGAAYAPADPAAGGGVPASNGGATATHPPAGNGATPSATGAPVSGSGTSAGGSTTSTSTASASHTPPAAGPAAPATPVVDWFATQHGPVTIKYDFRSQGSYENHITPAQEARAVEALQAWSAATGGQVNFVRDTSAPASQIVNIGTGDLAAFGFRSQVGGLLGVGGAAINASAVNADASPSLTPNLTPSLTGAIWLDDSEAWDTTRDNGDPPDTYDCFTVVAHEAGHVLGYADTFNPAALDIMNGSYDRERPESTISWTVAHSSADLPASQSDTGTVEFDVHSMSVDATQLSESDVQALLQKAANVSADDHAIIAVVDRNGSILGVRVEQGVLDDIPDTATRVFAIDGAVAEARTAAFFSNGDPTNIDGFSPQGTLAPLTSRTIRFISQSTVTQREVESNPNIPDPNSPLRGPGFVAPIGLGGHFPPEVQHTPPVDLFAIEHTNRDSLLDPGPDGIKGTADDFTLRSRFNIDPAYVPSGQAIDTPESYGTVSGLLPTAQSRGIGTLPGGIPLFRDTNGDGVGDKLVGGIGVFFPGKDGYATHEQGFVPGIGQTEAARTNAPLVLEAEYIAFVAAGGSTLAEAQGAEGAKAVSVFGSPTLSTLDVPFGRLDLVGIQLQVIGPTAGIEGVKQLLAFGSGLKPGDPNSGADQPLQGGMQYNDGQPVPEGWLVVPHGSTVDNLTAFDVLRQINDGIGAANVVRSAIRLNGDGTGGIARSRMVFAVTDTTGEVLGLYRMRDATFFSIDVAVAKARNTSYYADPTVLQPIDQTPGVAPGVAFTNRTFRFLAEPRYPSGVDGTPPPPFSILNDPGINPLTAENLGAPAPAAAFQTVLGHDAFTPMSNFRDPGNVGVVAIPGPGLNTNTANQNGIVFFPGSTPVYRGPVLIGGLGVSGDGVDQDDVVTFFAARDYMANGVNAPRADQASVNNVRLPYIKFLRNPFG